MNKNKLGFTFFLILLAIIIVGGFFLTKYMTSHKLVSNYNDVVVIEEEKVDNRIDNTKEYIYLTDETLLISGITTSVVNINLPSGVNIQNDINKSYDNNIVYLKDVELEEDAEVLFTNDEEIYSLSYVEYSIIEIGDYATLIVQEYDYNIISLATAVNVDVYMFDKVLDEVVDEDEILKSFNTTISDVKEKIKVKLTALNVYDDTNLIEETINNFSNYGIYVNRVGELEITYVVKSTNGDYYDKLVIS